LTELFRPLKGDRLTPKNLATLISACYLNDLIVNKENTVTVMETNLRKIDAEQVKNARSLWSELRLHQEKDIFNPTMLDDINFFEDILESEC
jgi:hypothetical protein